MVRFNGSVFINLNMRIRKLSEKITPIKIEQSNLNKFFPGVPEPKQHGLIKRIKRKTRISMGKSYTLRMKHDGTIYIKEEYCSDCGRRLLKNGYNRRIAILDDGLGKHEFRIHRKRCPQCGEIKPNYSKIAPKHGNYHENYKRRARQHYMQGLMPSQIQKVFRIDFSVDISLTTIVNWINDVARPLREMLSNTPVPSSGYWGYDEIHMRIGGEKMYTLDAVDVVTKFFPAAKISRSMGRKAGLYFFKDARCHNKLKINGLVKDCSTNLGALLRTFNFKHIIQQNCLTHVKWIISKHVKAFVGLSIRSKKPIPIEWRWLLKRFYSVIDSGNEANAFIQLEILQRTIERLDGRKIKHLHTAFKNLRGWFPKIIAHQRNPSIPTTNNLLESYHKKFTYYPSFKRSMMTMEGAQRVLDYRVFGHNFKRYPTHIDDIRQKYEEHKALPLNIRTSSGLKGAGRYFSARIKKLSGWFENYLSFWIESFMISNL